MSNQIKGKYLKNDQIDGSKILLLNDQAVRALKTDGTEEALLKLNTNNQLVLLKMPVVSADAEADNELVRKSQLDQVVEAEKTRAEGVENELQEQIDTEKERVDAILLAADADKDTFAEIVQLINSVDTDNDSAFAGYVLSNDARVEALETFSIAQVIYVSKSGSDVTGTGGQHRPYLTLTKAFSMITDASPSKRYVVRVAAGSYTESSVALPANVFVVGEQKEAVRITGAVSMGTSFNTGSSTDDRSGFGRVSLLSAVDFNWNTVQSRAGKLYLSDVVMGSTLNLNGYNNAIAQAQFNSCVIFGAITISGINVGVFSNNVCFGNITLNQHPNGGMATLLVASGGYCSGTIRQTTTVNDFNRRCASFLRAFPSENLIVDGPSSYSDFDLTSGSKQGAQSLNGGSLVPLNPIVSQRIVPNVTNSHNLGDWGKQWMFHFAYIHAATGSDLYLITVGEAYNEAGDSAGRTVFIEADGYGLMPNVNGGNVSLKTASVSGTGVRGKVVLDAKEVDLSSTQIKNLAAGTEPEDAVNKAQLDALIQFNKERMTVTAEILEANYLDLQFAAKPNSIVLSVDRLMLHEGYDYSVSLVDGVSRVTFLAPMVEPSEEALEEGDMLTIVYAK